MVLYKSALCSEYSVGLLAYRAYVLHFTKQHAYTDTVWLEAGESVFQNG